MLNNTILTLVIIKFYYTEAITYGNDCSCDARAPIPNFFSNFIFCHFLNLDKNITKKIECQGWVKMHC